jgi:hypothetical protein
MLRAYRVSRPRRNGPIWPGFHRSLERENIMRVIPFATLLLLALLSVVPAVTH